MDNFCCDVLIIDDEEELAKTLATRFELRDISTRIAYNGKEGLILLQEKLPDIVLLDMCMPELSGLSVLREIRRLYGSLPVLVITGYCSQANYTAAEELSVQGYHTKPINIDELLANIFAVTTQNN